MPEPLAIFRRLLVYIATLEKGLGALLILNIVLNIGAQVFSRYVLNRPLIWVEELATYSFIWATFIGASLGLKSSRHIRIETMSMWASQRVQAALRIVTSIIVLVILLQLLPIAWTVIGVEGRSNSISLPWPIPRSWFYSIPLMIGASSMALTTVYLILVEIGVARGRPRPEPIIVIATGESDLAPRS